MIQRDLIVVGASAGGLDALKPLVAGLPAWLPAAIFVVWHTSPEGPSLLPEVLNRVSSLPAHQGVDGEAILPGHIYVAPPDHHLLIERDRVRVTRGPKENRFRPAVDALFRSAAYAFGARVIGVVLSGLLDDGTAGLWAVKDRGGVAVVQNPEEAIYPSMPVQALQHVAVDHVVGINEMIDMLVSLTEKPVTVEATMPTSRAMEIENKIALEESALAAGVLSLGSLSPYTCPECHGVLVQIEASNPPRFRCHTGHAFSMDGLLAAINESIDHTLWNAVRVLEERLLLLQQMEEHARAAQNDHLAAQIAQQIHVAKQYLQRLRPIALSDTIEA